MKLPRRTWRTAFAVALLSSVGLARTTAAQSGTIRGTVTDSSTQRGVPGAQVSIVGSTRGALTNDAGQYTIRNVPAGAVTVRAQRIGFTPAQRAVTLAGSDTVAANFTLGPVASQLGEVLTIGYGTASRQDVSSAIASVDSTAISNIPVAGVDNAIQGKIAGVQVMQNSGEPGGGVSIRVRGPASLNAGNQPLYVVDGIPIIQQTFDQIGVSYQDMTAITGLNPDEIASIDVLKDAAAAAIYGSRGSNGVVLITTKRGQSGRTKFTLNAYAGTQTVDRTLPLLNAQQYVTVMNEARTNEGRAARYAPAVADSLSKLNNDWQGAIFRQAPVSDIQLALSGGTDRIKFYVTGGNFNQRGIVISSGYQRQSARVNLDITPVDKLLFTTSIGLTRESNDRVPGDANLDGVVTNAIAEQPFNPIHGSSFGYGGANESVLYSNPVAIAAFDMTNLKTTRAVGNIEAKYLFTDRLSLTGRAGADVYGLDELQWLSPKVDKGTSASVGGSGRSAHTTATKYLLESFLTLNPINSDRQKLSVIGGGSVEYNHSDLNYIRGTGFPVGFTTYVRNAANIVSWDGSAADNNLVSLFSRANWSLLDRYLLSASLRTDGSSRFGSANRYGLFPSVSLGWVFTDESFAKALARFATLKFRGSYGETGNQGIGDYASLTLAAAAPYSGAAGLAGSQLGNPNLQWEQTKEVDLGADMYILGGRVGFIADWYKRNTSNLLVQRPVPATSGYTTVWDNLGSIQNRGVDLGIHTINLKTDGRGLGWTSDLNVTWNHNEVTNLYGGLPITFTVSSRITSIAAVGQPLGEFYMYKFLRVDPQTGNAIYRASNGTETTKPTSTDLAYVGNPQPNYYGGFTNSFTFRSFDLRGFLQFSQGNKVFNMVRIFADDGGAASDNKYTNVLNRWQKPGDITNEPRMGTTSGANLMSSRMVEDGSFLRLGEITLGYRLPDRLTTRMHLDNAKIYASGRNLHTWTKYMGYNPDANSGGVTANVVMGVDYYAYPLARTFTFGVTTGW